MNKKRTKWDTYDREAAFWARVEEQGDCLVWTGATDRQGYGISSIKSKYIKAHRLAYLLTYGEMERGMVTDHICRNTSCVNPQHLEAITNRENVIRGNESRGVCKNGHPKATTPQLKWKGRNGRITLTCKLCRQLNKGYAKAGITRKTRGRDESSK